VYEVAGCYTCPKCEEPAASGGAPSTSTMEFKLWSLLLLIADRGGLQSPAPGTQGYVLDAGANDGKSAQILANAFKRLELHVLAVEPLASNVEVARRRAHGVRNLEVLHAGLGGFNGTVGHYPKALDQRRGNIGLQIASFRPEDNRGGASYPIVTIDALFATGSGRSLALAHLDLEGNEPDALHGANHTLLRDRPVLTVETYPVFIPSQHRAVMAHLHDLQYDVYTVKETVGGIPDGRNRVAIPRENRHLHWIVNQWF
jgi:FkbM family methyltransferase